MYVSFSSILGMIILIFYPVHVGFRTSQLQISKYPLHHSNGVINKQVMEEKYFII